MTDTKPIRRIAIIGTGVIGASWTALFLAKGLQVVATDPAPNAEAALQKFVEDPLSEALIAGGIAQRPAFLEVYMEKNQLFYRPISNDGEEKVAGFALSAV